MNSNYAAAAMLGVLVLNVSPAGAQNPHLVNAKQATRSAAAGLVQAVDEVARGAETRVWIGYAIPAVADRGSMCCGSSGWNESGCCGGCALEGGSRHDVTGPEGRTAFLEPSDRVSVFLRVEVGLVRKVRVFSEACRVDAGGRSVVWLSDVQPAQSLAYLKTLAPTRSASDTVDHGEGSGRGLSNEALSAIAMHRGDQADDVLADLASPSRPEGLRKQATFWMGAARGRRGYETLLRIVREDPSEHVRDSAVFGLSVSHEPEAITAMIAVARTDRSTHVRGQALFWLGQKASKKAAEAITEAIEQDPETDVKKKAVFALSQLPTDQGVPLLIQVARQNTNPAVRKQAMFWLGQSNDPRAIQFFEEILR